MIKLTLPNGVVINSPSVQIEVEDPVQQVVKDPTPSPVSAAYDINAHNAPHGEFLHELLVALAKNGQAILAIKTIRHYSRDGWGLKEAKAYYDRNYKHLAVGHSLETYRSFFKTYGNEILRLLSDCKMRPYAIEFIKMRDHTISYYQAEQEYNEISSDI